MHTRAETLTGNIWTIPLRSLKALTLVGCCIVVGTAVSYHAVAASGDADLSAGCPAFEDLIDSGANGSSEPDAGQLAALAECMVQQAASDAAIMSDLISAVAGLSESHRVPATYLQPVKTLARRSQDNSALGAAAFFAAGAIMQAADAARLIDAPSSKNRVHQVFKAIAEFSARAEQSLSNISAADSHSIVGLGSILAAQMRHVSAKVTGLAKEAAVVARRDMAASVALRANSWVRSRNSNDPSTDSSTDPSTGRAGTVAALESLFNEANDFANRQGADFASPDDQVTDVWLTGFDKRMLAAVQQISPGATDVAGALDDWHTGFREKHKDILSDTQRAQSPEVLVELAPDQMRSELYETAEALRRVIPEVRREVIASSGMIDRSMFGQTSSSVAALDIMDQLLFGAGLRLRRLVRPEELVHAWESRHLLKLLVTWTLEASAGKSRTTPRLVEVLTSAMSRLTVSGSPFLRMEDFHELHGIIEDQTSETWVRAFVNRRMAVVYAQSAILLGEAIAVPFTFGGSTAAMPATLHAIVVGLQVAGKATLAVTSSLNIADRYTQDGLNGLMNPSSALDALTVVMLLPRPLPGPVDAESWFGRVFQSLRNRTAGWMRDAGRIAVAGHAAFGAYQLAFAGHIAGTLRQQGYQVSESQIRWQALGHFGQAFLLGLVEWGEYRRGQTLGGDHYDAMVRAGNPINMIAKRLRNMVFPHESVIRTFNSLAPVIGKPLAGVAALVPAAGYLAYDYVIASEALMYFYAGSDYRYFSHNRSHADYPELAPGETAVTFVGFDQADLLYAGSHSIDAHKFETDKYGSRYFVYDFRSREDFLKRLEYHAREHGPVKYLRIMTHGLPGKLYTGDVANSAAVDDADGASDTAERDGWIDATWMRTNGDRIRQIAEYSMAPGARAVLFACLVGANMDQASPGIAQDAGDDFLRAMGETLLLRGGLIDSSVRFLIGMDTVFGGLLNWSARDEALRNSRVYGHMPVLPVHMFREGADGRMTRDEALQGRMAEALVEAASGEGIVVSSTDWAKSSEILQYAAARMWRMMTQLHKLGIRYGIQLEGPWWSTPRYKHARVAPVVGGAGAVEITITRH